MMNLKSDQLEILLSVYFFHMISCTVEICLVQMCNALAPPLISIRILNRSINFYIANSQDNDLCILRDFKTHHFTFSVSSI